LINNCLNSLLVCLVKLIKKQVSLIDNFVSTDLRIIPYLSVRSDHFYFCSLIICIIEPL